LFLGASGDMVLGALLDPASRRGAAALEASISSMRRRDVRGRPGHAISRNAEERLRMRSARRRSRCRESDTTRTRVRVHARIIGTITASIATDHGITSTRMKRRTPTIA
jgi:hypothetical protein